MVRPSMLCSFASFATPVNCSHVQAVYRRVKKNLDIRFCRSQVFYSIEHPVKRAGDASDMVVGFGVIAIHRDIKHVKA